MRSEREEGDKENLQFHQSRDMLYEECQDFIEELIEDTGKTWYSLAKSDAEKISRMISRALDIAELERYENALKRVKAEVQKRRRSAVLMDDIAFLDWLPYTDEEREEILKRKEDWTSLIFYEELGMLRKECEAFVEELIEDRGKPWYSFAKQNAERIRNWLAYTLANQDTEELEIYELELRRLKATISIIKEKEEREGVESAYEAFLAWQRKEEIIERDRDVASLRFYRKQDMLHKDSMEFVEELIEDMGKPWYYSAKSSAERMCEKIAHALDMKKLKVYEKELRRAKERVKRIKEKARLEGFE